MFEKGRIRRKGNQMKSNKIFAATAAAVLALSVLFTGCAQAVKYEPTESGVFVKRDGSVTGELRQGLL